LKLLRWTLTWTILVVGVTGILAILSEDGSLLVWKEHLRIAGGVFFLLSLFVGGILTTKPAETRNARITYREDWSFICLLVTISLFGISLFF
jgi:hypothetical protein